jgi:small subunit ribosomal protein S4
MIKKQKSNQKAAGKDLFKAVAPVSNAKKSSEYGKQLKEKQKVKEMYGLREAQFRRFFMIAKKSKDSTGETLLTLLESRLDNILFRLKLAKTRLAARKIIVHGHVEVDGKRVYSPSIIVSVNSVIGLSEKIKAHANFIKNEVEVSLARSIRVPDWLELNREEYKGRILRQPQSVDIQATINVNAIVELYSK